MQIGLVPASTGPAVDWIRTFRFPDIRRTIRNLRVIDLASWPKDGDALVARSRGL